MFSSQEKADCILWLQEHNSPTVVQRKFRTKYGRNKTAPTRRAIKIWHANFRETGSCEKVRQRTPTIDRGAIIQHFVEQLRQSLRRGATSMGVSHASVRRVLKFFGMKCFKPKIVQQLKPNDFSLRLEFAQTTLRKIQEYPDFAKLILFSDEAHNSSH